MRRLFDAFTSVGGGANSGSQADYVGKHVKIGSYHVTIESVIAEGGFAIVYCGRVANEKNKCALKRMFVNDDEQLAVCQYEIKLMRELNGHRNIVRYKAHSIKRQQNNGTFFLN